MNRRLAVLVMLALVPCASFAAEPVPFCAVEAPPLVYVTTSSIADFVPLVFNRSLYILHGGFTVVTVSWRLPGDSMPFSTTVAVGRGNPSLYRSLIESMASVRVGFREDCFNLPLDAHFTEHLTRFTWFGRGERQNTFLVTNLRPDRPPCPDLMDELLDLVEQYVIFLEGTQTLPAPPRTAPGGPPL